MLLEGIYGALLFRFREFALWLFFGRALGLHLVWMSFWFTFDLGFGCRFGYVSVVDYISVFEVGLGFDLVLELVSSFDFGFGFHLVLI